MTSEPAVPARRLHVAAVGAEALSGLRQLALPLLVLAVVGHGFSPMIVLYGVGGLVLSVVGAAVQWTTTRWYLGGGEVRLRRGVFTESVTTIPYDRIQAVDTVRGPVQRLLGAEELHVQSAGGGRAAEIVLRAVGPAEAEELRRAVRDSASGSDPLTETAGASGTGSDPLGTWRLGTRPLLAAALTSGSLGVLIPVVAGLSQTLDDVIGAEEAERLVPQTLGEAAVLVAVVLAVAWVLSFLGTIVAFAGFAVVRDGDHLRITRGIVERRESSVPVARVHAVRIIESPLREPFRLAQVRIETAGYAKERATAQTLLPLLRRSEVAQVLGALLPELDAPLDDVTPLPRRAARRHALPPALAGAAVAAALLAVLGSAALPALALVVAGALAGLARYRVAGVAAHGDRIVLRTRSATLARTTATADARRLQAVRTSVTPLQRRGRLATLAIDVASGRRVAVKHVDRETADAHFARLAAAATAPPRLAEGAPG